MQAQATDLCAPVKILPTDAASKNTADDPETKKKHDMAVANKKAHDEGWARWLSLLKSM